MKNLIFYILLVCMPVITDAGFDDAYEGKKLNPQDVIIEYHNVPHKDGCMAKKITHKELNPDKHSLTFIECSI